MNCECGFCFAGPGEFRNCEAYRTPDGQWVNACPECGREYVNGQSKKELDKNER